MRVETAADKCMLFSPFLSPFDADAWQRTNTTSGEYYLGDVLDFDTSPNDPLWWSHHAQLDRLHYYWMQVCTSRGSSIMGGGGGVGGGGLLLVFLCTAEPPPYCCMQADIRGSSSRAE